MAALIDLCNRALAQIAASSVADLDEGSLESQEVKRFALPLLDEVSEWADWPFAIARVALPTVANDRPTEWLFAYAAPSDLVKPVAVRRVDDPSITWDLTEGGPGTFPRQDAMPLALLHEGDVIFSNVESATLIYVRRLREVGEMPALLARAFELELAARIALPIKKDANLAMALARQAEVARARAVAEALNARGARTPRYIGLIEYARAGYDL
jgi:hypothetical protein